MNQKLRYDLKNSLGYQISIAARAQERGFEHDLKKLGLTRTFWCILLTVESEGVCQPSAIADYLGIDRTATSRALRSMENSGLVKRQGGKGDKRTTTVALTNAGRETLNISIPFAQSNADRFRNRLTGEERNELMRLLAKLRGGDSDGLKHL